MEADSTPEVLVVDDEEELAASYAAILESRYEVDTAGSGNEALATVHEGTDVVLLDRRLPEYSGTEILSAIRDRELDCQVVFCSAVVPDVDLVSIEPDGYLHKPVGIDELFDAIETQLQWLDQDEKRRETLRLESIRETVETARPASKLREDPQYRELLDRLEEHREQTSKTDNASAV